MVGPEAELLVAIVLNHSSPKRIINWMTVNNSKLNQYLRASGTRVLRHGQYPTREG